MSTVREYKHLFITFPLIILTLLIATLLFLSEDATEYRYNKLSDIITAQMRDEIEREKAQALTLAVTIAEHPAIRDALKNNKRELAYQTLQSVLASLRASKSPMERLGIQIHTADARLFVRSWDPNVHGEPLESFRKGIAFVKKHHKPIASIELGKRLNIKAVVPIIHQQHYLGSLEVIRDFEDLIKHFADRGISLLVLLDDRYLKTASWMTNNPSTHGFVICHQHYDKKLFAELSTINFYLMLHTRTMPSENYLIMSEPMRDITGERLGFFVLAIERQRAKSWALQGDSEPFYLTMPQNDFDETLRFEAKQASTPLAHTLSLQELYRLYTTLPDPMRRDYAIELRERLTKLQPSELVELILQTPTTPPKTGEIR